MALKTVEDITNYLKKSKETFNKLIEEYVMPQSNSISLRISICFGISSWLKLFSIAVFKIKSNTDSKLVFATSTCLFK